VVSLTPIAVEHDSRTFKQAASMSRFGFESVVVEGVPSRLPRGSMPFELVSAGYEDGARKAGAGRAGRLVRYAAQRLAPDLHRVGRRLWLNGTSTARATPAAALYYLHSPHQYPAVVLRGRGRVPFVYDAHDFYPAGYAEPPPGEERWFRTLVSLERRCMRQASEVVTVSNGCADLIEEYFGRRPLVIPNVHDPRIDVRSARSLRSELGLSRGEFLAVMVGNAKPGTAVEQALEAFRGLPQRAHLAFVGGGWGSYSDSVEAAGLAGRIHLCGALSPTRIVPFIESADIALVLYLPHSADYVHALPNRLFLPISAGVPLIYPSHLVELSALADRYGLGLPIDPRQPTSIASAVRRLLEDEPLRGRLRANVERAREDLSWEREEPRLQAIVEEAIGAGRVRAIAPQPAGRVNR
jgi:glycosyltransferase involved in cell wall biosynthesis